MVNIRLPREADLWLPGYIRSRGSRVFAARPAPPVHILFCLADHYEPNLGNPGLPTEHARVSRWIAEYPRLARGLHDADGRTPQHTFFFPAEAYRTEHLDRLSDLCHQGHGEVEVHLHHDHDTPENLRATLETFRDTLAVRHGLLSYDSDGRRRYAFIHGNWALDNSRRDGRHCGVTNEIDVLLKTGCYADLTMPAVPDSSQSRMVNAIYYATGEPTKSRSHDRGEIVTAGQRAPQNALLMIQGPLMVGWRMNGHLRLSIDNGAIDSSPGHHPAINRFRRWVRASIAVRGREDWLFVKVYTHGAPERNADVLLGDPMRRFHESLLTEFNDGERFQLHYVTAREMANLVLAAQAGETGDPVEYRDYVYKR